MNEYIPALVAVIAGLFATVSAIIAWRLKSSSDEKQRIATLEKEHRDETKELYTRVFVLFEKAIRQELRLEEFTLGGDFSNTSAQIHLLATKQVGEQYSRVAALLERWSVLHRKATPQQMKVGEATYTLIQAPDPTAPYKEPAAEAYDELHRELHTLVDIMRGELASQDRSFQQWPLLRRRSRLPS